MDYKLGKSIVLAQGDYRRIILQFYAFKGRIYLKIAEQWRKVEDDVNDNNNWKWNKSQINMNVEFAINFLKSMEQFTSIEILQEIEEFMINSKRLSESESEAVRLEK